MPEKLLVHGYRSLPFAKVVFLYSDHKRQRKICGNAYGRRYALGPEKPQLSEYESC